MQSITHPEQVESHATHLREGYFMGCLPGVVTNVNDPNKAGRIKVKADLIDPLNDLPNAVDGWIPVTTRYVLTDSPGGDLAPLQVGSQVILLPIMGRMDNWICIGAIHSSAEPPHPSHSLEDGSHGEHTASGVTHVRTGDAAEVKSYPHGVVKGVSSTGDIVNKTSNTAATQTADGKVLLENPHSSMGMGATGTVDIQNRSGSRMSLDDKGTIAVDSGHKSSMRFSEGKVEVVGTPNKSMFSTVDAYKTDIAKAMGGLGEMFSSISSIDLQNLNSENINGIIGSANDLIAKGQAVAADYESARGKVETILTAIEQNPLEAIKLVSPQVSDFIDNNLHKVLPLIRQAIKAGVGGAGVLQAISAYLPPEINLTEGMIQARINSFKTNPKLGAKAILEDIYSTAATDYEILFGSDIEYSVDQILSVTAEVPPTWAISPQRSADLLSSESALFTTLAGPKGRFSVPPNSSSPSEIMEKLVLLYKTDPVFLEQAVAAAWRKRKIAKIRGSLTRALSKKLSEDKIELIADAETPIEAISRLAVASQSANLKDHQKPSPALDGVVASIQDAQAVFNRLDRDDRKGGVASLVGLSGNPAYPGVTKLLKEVGAAKGAAPITRDIIGDFTLAITGVRNRLSEEFTQEDELCKSTIRFVLAELDKYTKARIATWEKRQLDTPNWVLDSIALTFWTDQLVADTTKYAVSYPSLNLFWDDLRSTVQLFIKQQKEVDRKIALQAIAAQLAADSTSTLNKYYEKATAPVNWVAPESFALAALPQLYTDVEALGAKIAAIPHQVTGCDASDATVIASAAKAIKEILHKVNIFSRDLEMPMRFSILLDKYDSFEKDTARLALTATVRDLTLATFKTGLTDLFAQERVQALERRSIALTEEKLKTRRGSKPTEPGQIAYATVTSEYRQLQQKVLAEFNEETTSTEYAQQLQTLFSELNLVLQNWFSRNAQTISASELIDLPGLANLVVVINEFIQARASYQIQSPQINLIWIRIRESLDYLLFYPEPENLTKGTNSTDRKAGLKLPGTYGQPTPATPVIATQANWLLGAIEIAKSVMRDIVNVFPAFKEYQATALQVLDTLPSILPASTIVMTDSKIEVKASKTGSKVTLGEGTAKLESGGGAAGINLGKGTASMTTGRGAALNLGANLGKLTGGLLGGEVTASTGGANISGPGGLSSIGAGAGGLSFSTPWGGFGFGSDGFGMTGDQPVNFAIKEADYDGGVSALYLDPRRGVGIHSTEIFTNFVSAQINVFDGRITINCPRNPLAAIIIDEAGVTIGGVNMAYFTSQFGYIFQRLYALENP